MLDSFATYADIKAANRKHQNDTLNRAIQNFLYGALEDPHEAAAKKSLAVLIELWQRQVWRDARTVNVIGRPQLCLLSSLFLGKMQLQFRAIELTSSLLKANQG